MINTPASPSPFLPKKALYLSLVLGGCFLFLLVLAILPVDFIELRKDFAWNVFLALLPLFLSICCVRLFGTRHRLATGLLAFLWLIFFPNAPYMFTDLIHLARFDYSMTPSRLVWINLCYILFIVVVGCVSGELSLYLMHRAAARRFGAAAGWLFCGGICLVSGIAIYIGRFLRFNSWDLLTRPQMLAQQLFAAAPAHIFSLVLLFSFVTLAGYWLFWLCFDEKTTTKTTA